MSVSSNNSMNLIIKELNALKIETNNVINSQIKLSNTINDATINIKTNNNIEMIKQYNEYFDNLILDN